MQLTKKLYKNYYVWFILLSFCSLSCKKFVDVDAPVTNTYANNVYNSDATAAAVLTGIYANMANSDFSIGGITSLPLYAGLSSDELTLFSLSNTTFFPYYSNGLTKSNTSSADFWMNIYSVVFFANSAIEGLNSSNGLTPKVKQHLLGEAKFVRAFCYFYLVNLYGDVPLVTTTDYKTNSQISRTPKDRVYEQIVTDLKESKDLCSSEYLKADAINTYGVGSEEKVRPNKWAASALLSRVYLFMGDFASAEQEATSLIENSTLFGLTSLDEVFQKNSKEAIWQLQPTGSDNTANTKEGRMFVLLSPPNTSNYPVYLSDSVVKSFEAGDNRRNKWVDSVGTGASVYYYPYKYKVGYVSSNTVEYSMVLRLGEQYLIRAEARAERNNLSGAQSDLDTIRRRAGLPDIQLNDKASLLSSILKERRVELFTEWGHRWFDIKRMNLIDFIMSSSTPSKGGNWEATDKLFPIPQYELTKNQNITQNPGY